MKIPTSTYYRKIDQEILGKLRLIVGPENVISEPEKMHDYSHDEFSLREISRMPEVVVKPRATEEVAALMKLAALEKIPVTPRGGGTGLCGGCVPVHGGIVLSLERMNRIVEIDLDNQMAVVEAGVTLRDFAQAAKDAGLSFPPHPGEESAMIGGLIATNAGGSRAVKYGVVRNYVRGLEVVLPQGHIIHLGGKIIKNSTGYNLLHLMIGSEGTLGIITGATIQLMPASQLTRTLVVPYEDLESAIDTVPLLIRKKVLPMAVEFIEREVITITEEYLKKKWPCSMGRTYLLIILDASSEEEMDRLSESVASVCLEKGAVDIFIADTPGKQDQVLEIRSKIYEAIKAQTIDILDISIPRAEIARHVRRIQEICQKYDIWLPTFGHAADGNVHTHMMKARYEGGKVIPLSGEEWREKFEKARAELYQDCKNRGGMISGEHGIGLIKKRFLSSVLGMNQMELMKGIKRAFDPDNILNPNKIFD